ncbi:MAG: hypothetical protein WBB29_23070 [Geitlerinemataceae cyanobacterium]
MNNFKWQSSELEWVERVRQLCVEIARSTLAEIPKLPENLSQKALPLAERGQDILDAAKNRGIWDRSQYPQLEWVDRVRLFFLELSRLSLSEYFRLPDHLSQRSLDLAEEAQDIQEAFETSGEKTSPEVIPDFQPSIETSIASHQDSLNADRSPGLLLEQLRKSVKIQWANSSHPDAQEWQQLINLLDLANSLYLRVKE